jgi:hypothetical protein
MFKKKIKMEGKYWGVFLVNPSDAKDRYLLTNPLDREDDADHFVGEFQRIAGHKLIFGGKR